VASQKSKRRSRKRRGPGTARAAAVSASQRAQARSQPPAGARGDDQVRRARRRPTPFGAYGERPSSPFGGLPVSEFAIFAGAVVLIIGVIRHGGLALPIGVLVCLLGVAEITAREHFSGYRSHASLLAAIPAVIVEVVVVLTVGAPRTRALLLVLVVPVFAVCFWFLRRRFLVARQARLARPQPARPGR
jgi:hypothetical protein